MTPRETIDSIIEFAQSRTVIVPVGMILGGLLGLAVGARSQKDAVGLVVGLAVGFGAADKLAGNVARQPVNGDVESPPVPQFIPTNSPPAPVIPPGGVRPNPITAKPAASPPSAA